MTTALSADSARIVVIGGGQAGLACAFYLRRASLNYIVLDAQPGPGGAWSHGWDSLRLFSPAAFSSLPGWRIPTPAPLPDGSGTVPNPSATDVVDYLTTYEQRYELTIQRPVTVTSVAATDSGYQVTGTSPHADGTPTNHTWQANVVINATGTWSRPFTPDIRGRNVFHGRQVHSAHYQRPTEFTGQRVAVIGGANSGAQIVADLLDHAADVFWCTLGPPQYLPDDVDGRALFGLATKRVTGEDDSTAGGIANLGNIVVVPPVKRARDAGQLVAYPMFDELTADSAVWADGSNEPLDAIIWCTGFAAELGHLHPLGITGESDVREQISGTAVTDQPGLYCVGYGDWTGPGSATLMGSARTARDTANHLKQYLADGTW